METCTEESVAHNIQTSALIRLNTSILFCYFILSHFHSVRSICEDLFSQHISLNESQSMKRLCVCIVECFYGALPCSPLSGLVLWTGKKKVLWISRVQSLLLYWGADALQLQPRLSHLLVSRSQSALCCSVFPALFVVLNLIVINIFDLLCTWQAYLKRNCSVWLVLHFEMYFLESL